MLPMAQDEEEYFLQQLDYPAVAFGAAPDLANVAALSPEFSSDVPEPYPEDPHNGTVSSPVASPSPLGEFPLYLAVIIALVFFAMTSTVFYFLCRCLARKKKRDRQLAELTPKKADPRMMAGVRANQPIEFVVPSTTAVVLGGETVTTEDSVSETDYSSSGAKTLPMLIDRTRRKRAGFQIDPAELQHGLYVGVTAASTERGGIFLGDLGKIGFSLRYNVPRNQLTVRIIGARDLPCHLLRTTANPYVKLVLLPDKSAKYVTRVLRNTSGPHFDECFSFCVRGREALSEKRLKISVWDYDRFSRKCLIGQVVYHVRDSGLTRDSLSEEVASGEIWADLKRESATQLSENGEMLLSLCYDPDSATLTLTVLKVRGLDMQRDRNKDTSIYAKVTLYVRRKLVRTKKTPSRKKAPEVELASPFSIHVPPAALREVDLMVALCEKWPLGGKRVVGRTQAGTHCLCDQGLQHWQDMLASPKSTCAQWHVLCG